MGRIILITLISLIGIFTKLSAHKHYLSICAIFRDEDRFLKEWIEFHRLQGVDHFYLYNHLNQDNYLEILQPYIQRNIVTLINWNLPLIDLASWGVIQMGAYNDAFRRFGNKTQWMAILDTDEFLFTVEGPPLKPFLKDFEEYGALGVNWQMYGTSNVEEVYPSELMIQMLLLKAPIDYSENKHIKSIVNTKAFQNCTCPHFVDLKPPYQQINESREPFSGPLSPYVSINKIRINHYWSRDLKFFNERKIKRRGDFSEGANEAIEREAKLNREEDHTILRWATPLKRRIKKHYS